MIKQKATIKPALLPTNKANGIDINAEMVRRGAAWVYLKYAKDPSLSVLEAAAKRERRGLWGLPEDQRIPPWEWRHAGQLQPLAVLPKQGSGGYACAGKKMCRQMTGCEEARFYLEHCGVSSLDGNHDGIPCSRGCADDFPIWC